MVRKEFDDIELDDDITTPRASLKVASLIKDNDNGLVMICRLILYHIIVKGFGLPEIYSVPVTDINDSVRYHPKIFLNFSQNYREVDASDTATTGQISLRLMGKTAETLTQSDVNTYAQKIKTLFGNSGGFSWRKGKNMLVYTDPQKGYFLQILVQDQTEGKRIVEQVLDIQSHTPDWQYANYKENLEPSQAFPVNPPNKILVGKSRKQYKKRPVVTVRFKFAELHVQGLPNPYILYDKTGRYKRAILQD